MIVEADADRLRQVLTNLAANSAAAGADQRLAQIQWADDGPGFRRASAAASPYDCP